MPALNGCTAGASALQALQRSPVLLAKVMVMA
jgi:hypothetical protein